MAKISTFEIIAGTYEEYLLGYHFVSKSTELLQSFAAHDHSASIRCVAQSGQYLATGAADDRIFIYDLKTRKEHCMLTNHESTINTISFTVDHSHVISGSNDGTITIVRVGNWQLEKIWKEAHRGAIYDIAVHSTGKLALSIGADQVLKTWNLVKGRLAYAINLNTKSKDPKSLEKIVWGPDDAQFVLFGGKYTEIWSIEVGGIIKIIEHNEKVSSCIWVDSKHLLIGYWNGGISKVKIDSKKEIRIQKVFNDRVKSVEIYKDWIVAASSGGEIKVFDNNLEEIVKINSSCRITCLIIVPPIKEIKLEEQEEKSEIVQEIVPKKNNKSRVVIEIENSDEEREKSLKKVTKKKKKRKIKEVQPTKKANIQSNGQVKKKKKVKKKTPKPTPTS